MYHCDMHTSRSISALFTLLFIGSLIVLSSCTNTTGPTPQGNASPTKTSAVAIGQPTNVATVFASPVVSSGKAVTAKIPPLSSIHMIDALTGWAFTQPNYPGSTSFLGGDVLRTSDGGMHWKDVTPPYSRANRQGYATSFLDASVAWLAVSQGQTQIYHTTDGGQTWQVAMLPSTAHQGNDAVQITFVNAQDGWLLFSGNDTGGDVIDVFHTSDGGKTWGRVSGTGTSASPDTAPGHLPLGRTLWGLGFLSASTGWATSLGEASDSVLFVTHNGGSTWQAQKFPVPATEVSNIATLPPTFVSERDGALPVLLFGSDDERAFDLYTTHDGGVTWNGTVPLRTSVYTAGGVGAIATTMKFVDMSTGWFVGEDGGQHQVYMTADGGQHWAKLTASLGFTNITTFSLLSGTTGWVIDAPDKQSSRLLRTIDSGHTWTEVFTTHLAVSPCPTATTCG
jgi:photosystem II stability/assembly factor-like uncharacterized protein